LAEKVTGLADPLTRELQRRRGTSCTANELEDVTRYVHALRRKSLFVAHHLDILRAIRWPDVLGLGRRNLDGQERHLSVPLDGCEIIFRHPEAVIDHAYLSFDGLIAGCVNLTDTFARAINLAYVLGEPERRVHIKKIMELANPNCPVGLLLSAADAFDWWQVLRDLRGTCQHAGVEHVLKQADAPSAAALAGLAVPTAYALPWAPATLGASDYGAAVSARVVRLMVPLVDAVINDPANAIQV
jgi:hypothetical protein